MSAIDLQRVAERLREGDPLRPLVLAAAASPGDPELLALTAERIAEHLARDRESHRTPQKRGAAPHPDGTPDTAPSSARARRERRST